MRSNRSKRSTNRKYTPWLLPITMLLSIPGTGIAAQTRVQKPIAPAPKLDYNRDIRPILAAKCFACHGADEKGRMASLRLDMRPDAVKKLSDGKCAIVPGKPALSEVIKRINMKGPGIMPPADSQKTLNAEDRAMLTRWVAEGAEYRQHWAFVKPVRPTPPAVHLKTWVKNPIDNFILSRLEQEGLKPSPEADKFTLIRRLSLDLIGIPPSPDDIKEFINDHSPNAYESLVDRLLRSRHYGERMALNWLDGARYADSNGYQADYERFQWRWRDWVLDAFNANMPFDQFTIEQIAGDMLPNATMSQKLATGFNRNHRINTEGGIIPEEWRVETVIDRVETTSAVWLGLSMGCGRCHDHKYDPITQKEFYKFYSYFNNVPESGTGVEAPVNHPPLLKAPTAAQQADYALLDKRKADAEAIRQGIIKANASKAAQWMLSASTESAAATTAGLQTRVKLGSKPTYITGGGLPPSTYGKIEDDPGRVSSAAVLNGRSYIDLGDAGDFDTAQPFSYGAWINPQDGNGVPLSKMDSENNYRGWDLYVSGGHISAHIVSHWPDDALKVTTTATIANGDWSHVLVSYDGSAKPSGVHIFINGIEAPTRAEYNGLKGSIKSTAHARVGGRTGSDMFKGKVEDAVIFNKALNASEALIASNGDPARQILSIAPEKRTPEQKQKLVEIWCERNDNQYKEVRNTLAQIEKERTQLDGQVVTAMVMDEMPKPRECYVLVRGQYDKHGDVVTAGLPAAFPPLPKGAPNNRLGLAMWIASPDNPLTARVAVNRFWEKFFGTGIVATTEDFGTRADFPSHPELLDWLATEFVRLKWDMKAMQKEIVMSATYRQSSRVTPALMAKDPLNRLLARGPRFRLQAEVIRDQALAACGVLAEKVGGPSVRPYQPDGIWDETNVYGNLRNYKHDKGEGLYRRSIYTIWKRTAAPPTMTLFDVPGREACRVRRARTDTPLQALVLMNETTFVEASRILAQKMLTIGGATPEQRINYAFLRTVSRPATAAETRILAAGLQKRLEYYKSHPEEAEKLVSVGDYPREPGVPIPEVAAYTLAASVLLNSDEMITRE
jgi:Protein of unknown function (DUF1553)/Protein of unknown function (DUF1549)/Concanavalin A-like lectin/glucanases superfamily/Planctomycete cytochrome C